jgi:hypothetical protein
MNLICVAAAAPCDAHAGKFVVIAKTVRRPHRKLLVSSAADAAIGIEKASQKQNQNSGVNICERTPTPIP